MVKSKVKHVKRMNNNKCLYWPLFLVISPSISICMYWPVLWEHGTHSNWFQRHYFSVWISLYFDGQGALELIPSSLFICMYICLYFDEHGSWQHGRNNPTDPVNSDWFSKEVSKSINYLTIVYLPWKMKLWCTLVYTWTLIDN